MDLHSLCDDLLEEREELFEVLCSVEEPWSLATPAPRWTVVDQLSHLAWFDGAATLAIADPDGFVAERHRALAAGGDIIESARLGAAERSGEEIAEWLRSAGDALVAAALAADPAVRVPWYGPSMSLASCITARIMETWAHAQDVFDALGVTREPSPRLVHIAFLGWRAIANSFTAHGLDVPSDPVRVELGDVSFGPADAANRVTGSLLDFCLVVTQRRHVADTNLAASGPVAEAWLPIAQAFAGPPGQGRSPSN